MYKQVCSVGKAIAKARKEKGYSQRTLAAELGTYQHSIYEYEADKHSPNVHFMIAIADVLDVSMDELCGRVKE